MLILNLLCGANNVFRYSLLKINFKAFPKPYRTCMVRGQAGQIGDTTPHAKQRYTTYNGNLARWQHCRCQRGCVVDILLCWAIENEQNINEVTSQNQEKIYKLFPNPTYTTHKHCNLYSYEYMWRGPPRCKYHQPQGQGWTITKHRKQTKSTLLPSVVPQTADPTLDSNPGPSSHNP